MRLLRLPAAGAALAVLAGCAMLEGPRVEVAAVPPGLAVPVAVPEAGLAAATPGAIFNGATHRPLFEDHRARLPGDTLQVVITERIAASARSTSAVERSGSIDASVSALPGIDPTRILRPAAVRGQSETTFEGSGSTESRNAFSGTITAVVTGVLPNGHLLIAGEKQIGVNANVDVLRFSGQVDPRSIRPGNSVVSTQIANVRVAQTSQGQQGQAQLMGWLARFFLSVLPI
jgi:flagellar L-ring protein precursor FlgH